MRRTTRKHIARLAIASLLVRVMLVAVFAPLAGALTTNHATGLEAADGSQLMVVLCDTHGAMTVPASDLGLGPDGDQPTTAPPVFCPFCLAVVEDFVAADASVTVWAPIREADAKQPPTHARARRTVLDRPHAQPRAPPAFPTYSA